MDLGLIAGVVGAVATVAAAILAYMQLRTGKPAPEPWPEVKPPNDTSVRAVTPGTDEHNSDPPKPTPSAADFGRPVKVRMEQLPPHVFGRKALLRRLKRHHSKGGLVVLTGSGGMGKSTVARQLVRQMPVPAPGEDEALVWEVSAADLPSLIGGLITIAADLGASESDLQAISIPTPFGPDRFWNLLEQRPEGWLLIIDNADQLELLAAPAAPGSKNVPRLHDGTGWVRATRRGLLLVTSRQREIRRPESLRSKSNRNVIWPDDAIFYEVGPLEDDEAADVLLDWAPMAGDRKQAEKLGHRLGGLPLALRLAGQYLSYVSNSSFTAYLEALSDPEMIERIDLAAPPGAEREMVMFTWELSLNALADDGIPQARAMLRLVSCYASAAPIPLGLFTSELFTPLLRSFSNPPSSLVEASIRIDQGLQGLYRLGLIDPATLPGDEARGTSGRPEDTRLMLDNKNALVVHPVIADTNRAYLLKSPSVQDSLLIYRTAVNLLANVIDGIEDDRPTDWPNFRLFTPHLQALLELQALLTNSAGKLNDDTLDILIRVAGHTAMAYGQMRSPEFGLELVRLALSHTLQPAEDPTAAILIARQQLAHLLGQVRRPGEAATIYSDVLKVQRRFWPDDDPAVMATRRNLAGAMGTQGRSDEAQAALEDLLADEQRVFGEDDPNTLITRLQLAILMCARDRDWQQAEGTLRNLLADMQRVLVPDDRSILVTRYNLAQVILLKGRRTDAESLLGDLLADERRVLGEDHFLTVTTSNFSNEAFITTSLISTPKLREDHAVRLFKKAVTLAKEGHRDRAIEAYQQVIDRYGDDPDPALRKIVATALFNKGLTLAREELFEEASEAIERAIPLYEEMAAADPADAEGLDSARQLLAEVSRIAAQALLDQAVTLGQHQPDQAIEAYQQVIDRYGDDPDPAMRQIVATALLNKAVMVGQQGRRDEALETSQQLIDQFGGNPDSALHELVAKALLYQGVTLADLQRPTEALASLKRAILLYEEMAAADPADAEGLDSARQLLAEVSRIAAQALLDQAVTLGQHQPDQAIEAYQQVIDRYGDDPDPAMRKIVATALFNKAVTLAREELFEEASEAIERAIPLYEEMAAADPADAEDLDSARQLLAEVSRIAAQALLDQAVTLGQHQPDQAIEAYQQVIDRYGDDPDPAMRQIVATAQFKKSVTLGKQGQQDQAIEAYQQVIDRYGDDPDPALRKIVAAALLNKAVMVGQQGRRDEALETSQQLIGRYGDDPDPALRRIVAKAMLNKGLTLAREELFEEASEAIERAIPLYEELAAADPADAEGLDSARQLLADVRRLAPGPSSDPGPAS